MMDKVSDDYIINYLKNNYYCELTCSDIEGVGTFALRDIPYGIDPYIPFKKYILNSGDYGGVSGGYADEFPIDYLLDNGVHKNIITSFFKRTHARPKYVDNMLNEYNTGKLFMDFTNHSDNPNMEHYLKEFDMWVFVTKRDIKENEELTIDYFDENTTS